MFVKAKHAGLIITILDLFCNELRQSTLKKAIAVKPCVCRMAGYNSLNSNSSLPPLILERKK